MEKHNFNALAHAPVLNQLLFSLDGFTVEICRRPDSRATAFQLRYKAYKAVDAIPENEEELLYDDYDFKPNSQIFLVWYANQPVATVRACLYTDHYNWLEPEGVGSFLTDLNEALGPKPRILESNRYAVDPDFKGRKSLFAQMLMFRAHALSSAAHDCRHVITLVREKHIPFYKRFLGFEQLSSRSKFVEWANATVHLLGVERDRSYAVAQKHGLPPVTETGIMHFMNCAGMTRNVQSKTA